MYQTNWGMPWEGLKAKQIQIHHSAPLTATVHGADGDLQMHPIMHRGETAVFQAIFLSMAKQCIIVASRKMCSNCLLFIVIIVCTVKQF